MRLDEPSWWYGDGGGRVLAARALSPFAALYGLAAVRRLNSIAPYRSRLPVVCVGNFTAGGTGKTPLALYLCEQLLADGQFPVFLTRGFKGQLSGPLWVEPDKHTTEDVGDEPLLLARAAPTLVATDRAQGARFIESGGRRASVIIMDDGLQNPQLAKNLSFAVVDAHRGIGNGAVIPAGPLRAPLSVQLGLANAIVVNGCEPGGAFPDGLKSLRKSFGGPTLMASVKPRGDVSWLRETPTVAFAGIANPGRFFDLLLSLGGNVVATRTFGDHHEFSDQDARALLKLAFDHGARLVTTEKDLVRLSGHSGARGDLRANAVVLPIGLKLEAKDDIRLDALLKEVLGRAV